MIRDSIQQIGLPGVDVFIKNQQRSTNTNEAGEFEIDSRTPSAEVTFSFIGYRSITRTVEARNQIIVDMQLDPELDQGNGHVKASVELGYYADPVYAPFGAIFTNHIQSIGKSRFELTTVLKYWQRSYNYGFEASMNKQFSGGLRRVIDNIFVGYKNIDYPDAIFKLNKTSAVVSRAFLRHFFSIDAGAAYNQIFTTNEQGLLGQSYFSAAFGVATVINRFPYALAGLSGLGFQASVNYHPNRTMLDIGAFKGLFGRKLPHTVLMAKYYNYQEIQGWMLSVRFNLVSTEYYCCYSYFAHTGQIAALR